MKRAAAAAVIAALASPVAADAAGDGYLHTSGNRIVDAQNQPVRR
jgi:hypothetical protein